MNATWRIVIGYDGSEEAVDIFKDLSHAALPKNVEANVLSVADVWLPAEDSATSTNLPIFPAVVKAHQRARAALDEAKETANQAAVQLRALFPTWSIEANGTADSPAWAILKAATSYRANLITVGSRRKSVLSRALLGSVSNKVLVEAPCPVRIARLRAKSTNRPTRLLVGIDGSLDSERALDAIASRPWAPGTEVRVVTAIDSQVSTAAGLLPFLGRWLKPSDFDERSWVRRMNNAACDRLRTAGLSVTSKIKKADPRLLLLEEADAWKADCVFLGARGLRFRDRLFLGSVSAAVAERALCSVEVIRAMSQMHERLELTASGHGSEDA